jgi:hypothetical protein
MNSEKVSEVFLPWLMAKKVFPLLEMAPIIDI